MKRVMRGVGWGLLYVLVLLVVPVVAIYPLRAWGRSHCWAASDPATHAALAWPLAGALWTLAWTRLRCQSWATGLKRGLAFAVASGVVVGLVSANGGAHLELGRQKRTMADLRSLGTMMEAYRLDHGAYPPADELERVLVPTYAKSVPLHDGWGQPLDVRVSPSGYRIVSFAAWGEPDVAEGDHDASGPTRGFCRDIVFADGRFTRWPEGERD